jgi:hypothetical protein
MKMSDDDRLMLRRSMQALRIKDRVEGGINLDTLGLLLDDLDSNIERIKELEEFIESLQLSVGDDLRRFELMGKK